MAYRFTGNLERLAVSAAPSGSVIYVETERKVDLGVLRGADHDGLVLVSPFSTVDGVCFDGASSSR